MLELLTLLLPLLGTALGAASVFLLRRPLSPLPEKLLLGFSAGVMLASSFWSLLNPAIDLAGELGALPWLPALLGFLAGIGFLLLLDLLVPLLVPVPSASGEPPARLSRTGTLLLAVTLHNIPEGMAVGVAYAGAALGTAGVSLTAALTLSLGIAIQNFPEGAIISMPLHAAGLSRPRAFLGGLLSGVVEPLAGLLTVLFVSRLLTPLPWLLSFAAGAMLYVVFEKLMPDLGSERACSPGTLGAAAGFALMMVLDVALG